MRPSPRARPAADQGADAPGVARDRLPARARAAQRLADELEHTHPGAAGSLREGMDETLTVIRLGIKGKLRRTLESTNPCESMIDTVRTHPAQRQALVLRRDGAAVDRRRDARSREAVPQGDRLHRPTPPRGRDRTPTPPSPAQPAHDPGGRDRSHCVTITPGPSSPKFHGDRGNPRTTPWSAQRDRMDDWSLLPRRNAAREPAPNHQSTMTNTTLPARLTRPRQAPPIGARHPCPQTTALDPAGLARQPGDQSGAEPQNPTIPAITALPTPVHAPQRQHRTTTALTSPGPSWMTQDVFCGASDCWFATYAITPPEPSRRSL